MEVETWSPKNTKEIKRMYPVELRESVKFLAAWLYSMNIPASILPPVGGITKQQS